MQVGPHQEQRRRQPDPARSASAVLQQQGPTRTAISTPTCSGRIPPNGMPGNAPSTIPPVRAQGPTPCAARVRSTTTQVSAVNAPKPSVVRPTPADVISAWMTSAGSHSCAVQVVSPAPNVKGSGYGMVPVRAMKRPVLRGTYRSASSGCAAVIDAMVTIAAQGAGCDESTRPSPRARPSPRRDAARDMLTGCFCLHSDRYPTVAAVKRREG